MSEERLMILKLLEEGKISQEEAEKLLDALAEDGNTSNRSSKGTNREDRGRSKTVHVHATDFGKRMDDFGDRMDHFGEKFGDRMSHLGAQLADKSVSFAEKIIDFVEKNVDFESLSVDFDTNYKSYEEIFEELLPEEITSLSFKAFNGKINILSWKDSKIKVSAYIKTKEELYDKYHPIMQVKKNGNTMCVFPKDIEKLVLQLDVMVPEKLYDTIKAESKNASITVEDITSSKIHCSTKNASINLRSLKVENDISCATANGKIILTDLQTHNILTSTTNGKVELTNIKAFKIETLTTNGKIIVGDVDYSYLEYLHLKTSNGKIEIFLPETNEIAFNIEAGTSNGSIKSMLPLNYSENDRRGSSIKIVGTTPNYTSSNHICNIKAFTTNSNITISM